MTDGVECFDPFRPRNVSDPMRVLGRIRARTEACKGTGSRVLVLGHDACRTVLRELFTRAVGAPASDAQRLQGWATAVTARRPNPPSRDPDLVALNDCLARLVDRRRQAAGPWERVVRDRRPVRSAVEESLRLDAPVQVFMRTSTKALDLHGCPVEPGDRIQVHVGSAGRDERTWSRPEAFDLDRPRPAHLSFGTGIHYRAGADLARFEARITLEGLLDRYPRLRLADTHAFQKVAASHLHGPERVDVVASRPLSVAAR